MNNIVREFNGTVTMTLSEYRAMEELIKYLRNEIGSLEKQIKNYIDSDLKDKACLVLDDGRFDKINIIGNIDDITKEAIMKMESRNRVLSKMLDRMDGRE